MPMPILRRATHGNLALPNIRAIRDVPGFEAGRILHNGTCPLRGQVQHGGSRGPSCGSHCEGPTPPIIVEIVYPGAVLSVDEENQRALIWDLFRKRPTEIPLDTDCVFRSRVVVDASAGVRKLYENWKAWRDIEAQLRKDKEEAKRKAKEEADRAENEAQHNLHLRALEAEEARIRSLASILRQGHRVRVVEDPPGFAERMQRLKPRHRTPSLVGAAGVCLNVGPSPYVFIRLDSGPTIRVLQTQVRMVLADGTLGAKPV